MRVVSGEGAGTIYSLSPGFLTVGTQLDVMIPLPSSTAKKGSATGFYAEIPTEIAPKTNAAKEEQPTIRIHPLLHIRGAAHHGASSPLAGSVYDAVGKQPRGLKRIIANSQRRKQRKHGLLFSDIFIDGKELLETREVHLGEQIVLPTCTVEFARFDAAAIPVDKNTEYGHWLFARPPKTSRELPSHALKIPHEPARPEKMPIPLAMSLLPLAASIAMAYFMKNWTFLAFGIMSPIMMLSSAFSNNRQTRKRWKKQKRHWREVMERTKNKAQGLIEQESQQLRTDFPSPAAIAEIAETHNARLWERRINDSAWLCLRIGMGTVRSHITLEDMNEPEDERVKRWEMKDVPATVSLAQVGCLGIAGDASDVRRLASWFMLQMATLHSMHDLSLSLLSPVGDNGIEERANRWSFCQWLPHFRNTESRKSLRNIAITAEEIAAQIAGLTALLDARRASLQGGIHAEWGGSAVVTILDNAHLLRSQPGMIRLLAEGPRVGMYFICIDADKRLLPEECKTVLLAAHQRVDVKSSFAECNGWDMRADAISDAAIERTALALAPLNDASPDESQSALPNSCRLLSELGLTPTASQIESGWQLNPRSTSFLIGEAMGGPFSLDIAKDGPHALIAGTTGSGKSELLQSMVASLATANTPEEMNFVLVDYKGGAAFKDCTSLPHTVGMVTDLDNHLVARALVSLGAELTYREHLLGTAGAKDIDDYIGLRQVKPSLAPLPRLMIIIDEFASLSRELPDFVTGLVNIAQRGRSLGIHLVLATQKPGGVVSPEIRANTNLRIALRTTDASESQDVIDSKDAALISKTTPGRAVARLGSNTLIPFQSARVGGKHISANEQAANTAEPPFVRVIPFANLGLPAPARPKDAEAKRKSRSMTTDLQVLVEAINTANADMGFAEQRKPWMPELPTNISLDALDSADPVDSAASVTSSADGNGIPFALGDFPHEQAQKTLQLDPTTLGNLFIVGTARSGKSTALKTIVYSACTHYPVRIVHIYGIDAGNGALAGLEAFPHVGAIARRSDVQKVQRLIKRLTRELRQRSDALSSRGYGSIDEYNRNAAMQKEHPIPHILALIDSWAGFKSSYENFDNGNLYTEVQALMREGTSVGIHFIVTGDKELIVSNIAALSENKILLRLLDHSDYTLIGLSLKDIPDSIPNGRAYRSQDGAELQIAQIAAGTSGQEEAQKIRECAEALQRHARHETWELPFNVEQLPDDLSLTDLFNRAGLGYINAGNGPILAPPMPHGMHAPILLGIGGEDNLPIDYNPSELKVLPIAGANKSGKTALLASIAISAVVSGYKVLIASARASALTHLADRYDAIDNIPNAAMLTQQKIESLVQQHPERVILLDDAHLLAHMPAGSWLKTFIQMGGAEDSASIIAAVNPVQGTVVYGSWVQELKNCGTGIALQPTDGQLTDFIGTPFSRAYAATLNSPGRALFNGPDGLITLQTADSEAFINGDNNAQ